MIPFENVGLMTDSEVLKAIETALIRCNRWKSCKDGSYERALADWGYWVAVNEAQRRGLEYQRAA